MTPLASAYEHLAQIIGASKSKQIVVFLDYDGTLTPIVPRPEDAHLDGAMRKVLDDLSQTLMVAIVSGRDLEDVRHRVRLDRLYYAGSHGFEIAGPHGFRSVYGPAEAFLSRLDRAETELHGRLDGLHGAQVERKRFAIAIHYRRVDRDDIDKVATAVSEVQTTHPELRQTGGKKVFELRPDLDWHKGTALFWLLDAMQVDRHRALPVYIGDDVTDEDAFRAIKEMGIGIVVTDDAEHPTQARYSLLNTEAVRTFLRAVATAQKRKA